MKKIMAAVDALKAEVSILRSSILSWTDKLSDIDRRVATLDGKISTLDTTSHTIQSIIKDMEQSNKSGYHSNNSAIIDTDKRVDKLERKVEAYENQAVGMRQAGKLAISIGAALFLVIQGFVVNWVSTVEKTLQQNSMTVAEHDKAIENIQNHTFRPNIKDSVYKIAHPIAGTSAPTIVNYQYLRQVWSGQVTRWPDGAPINLIVYDNDTEFAEFSVKWLGLPPSRLRDNIAKVQAQGKIPVSYAKTEFEVLRGVIDRPGAISWVKDAMVYNNLSNVTIIYMR